MINIAIGCDPNAIDFKMQIIDYLVEKGYKITDMGSDDPIYANTAIKVAEAVAEKRYNCGVLFCGTGIGMSIAANKVKGAYAAQIADSYSADRARKSNDTNIACMGALTIGLALAKNLLDIWLTSEYKTGTNSELKVQRIIAYEHGIV